MLCPDCYDRFIAISFFIWVYLLLFRGGFWRVGPLLSRPPLRAGKARVAVIIPARDEAAFVGRALASLKAQQFEGELELYVVDDNSSDSTSAIAAHFGARVLQAGPLPEGWTGKLWAVSRGVDAALSTAPDFLLLTDADIVHGPSSVGDLVARDVALASVMVKLRCESIAERLLIPAFVFFFFKLYPPKRIANRRSKTAGAAGGCILIKPDVLAKIGGIAAIRGELIDDCALARAAKQYGPVWLGLTDTTVSIREYGTFAAVWEMIARTAFTQLGYSSLVLAGTFVGMFFTYLAPPIFTFTGSRWAAAAWLLMTIAYLPMARFYRQPMLSALLLPLVALFYSAATAHSAIRYWLGAGGQWKGRAQARRRTS